jgi:hypothetical protein
MKRTMTAMAAAVFPVDPGMPRAWERYVRYDEVKPVQPEAAR